MDFMVGALGVHSIYNVSHLNQGGVGIRMPDGSVVGRSSQQAPQKKWTSSEILEFFIQTPNGLKFFVIVQDGARKHSYPSFSSNDVE